MNHKELTDIVGLAAVREFDVVFGDWRRECNQEIDPYDTALIMFAAGYLARRNDELHAEHGDA